MQVGPIVPLRWIEYGSGYVVTRSPYTPYSVYVRGTKVFCLLLAHGEGDRGLCREVRNGIWWMDYPGLLKGPKNGTP